MTIRTILLALFLGSATAWGFGIGSTREDVIAELGKPTGTGKRGAVEFMYYGGSVVDIQNGKVIRMDSGLADYAQKRAQGLVKVDGKWLTPEQKTTVDEQKRTQNALGPKIKILAEGGKKVELKDIIVPGKITIVDFYADWCRPCREMSPLLEAFANDDADVYLRKVDIVNWESDVAHQYDLHSIPNVRVFNRDGKMVGDPTYDPNEVATYVKKAH